MRELMRHISFTHHTFFCCFFLVFLKKIWEIHWHISKIRRIILQSCHSGHNFPCFCVLLQYVLFYSNIFSFVFHFSKWDCGTEMNQTIFQQRVFVAWNTNRTKTNNYNNNTHTTDSVTWAGPTDKTLWKTCKNDVKRVNSSCIF